MWHQIWNRTSQMVFDVNVVKLFCLLRNFTVTEPAECLVLFDAVD